MAGETKVEFDVLAHDKASEKLDRVARAFKNVGKEAGNVGKNTKVDQLADKFKKAGDDSGRGFGASMKKWFTGEGGGLFSEIGKSGGTVFGSGLLGALKTPILGPALVAVVGGAVATAMPAVGAIAGGALVTGFGAGIAGLGLVFAAKSEAVKSVWSDTLSDMGADMRLLSKPFEGTLISIAGTFQRTVDKFNPALAKAFSKMAGPIAAFVDQAGVALEKLVPAIDPITDAFNSVLDSLGPALQSAVGDLASGMTDLANSISENPTALADLVTGLGSLTATILGFITTLNDINGGFEDLTGGLSLVEVALGGVKFAIGAVAAPFVALGGVISGVNALIGRTGKDVAGTGQSMSDAANKTVLLAQGLGATGTAAQHAGPAVQSAADKIKAAKDAAAEAKQKFEDFITSMFRLQNLSLGLSGAQVNLQSAIDDATQSIKDNGRTLDINTAAGRANKTALNNVASSANAQTEAMLRSGKGTAAAATAADKSRANFVAMAQKMGLSKTAAQTLARQMIAIPNVSREAKLKADKRDLDAKLKAAKAKLADKSLTATKRAKLTAEIASLQRQVNAAQAKINSLRGKTVTIRTVVVGGVTQDQGVGGGGRTPTERRAHGGPVTKGQPYIVGEKRAELFVPGVSGQIVPSVPTAWNPPASSARGGGGAVVLRIESGGSRMDDLLVELLRKAIRVQGGNVQTVLGTGVSR